MTSVTLQQLHKRYGSTPIVRDLSLEVPSGKVLALLGPSGCGKTTSLRMIAGLERIDGGCIRLGATTVDDGTLYVPPERRQLGMVFQSYAVWPHKSVADNVAYPLMRQGLDAHEVRTRTQEALGWVRLNDYAHRRPNALSGGQLQRVAIARALVARPQVLLMDEPLSNLDAALKEELRAEIATLVRRAGTTVVYVTHDQSEAMSLADIVTVMREGRILQTAAPQQLFSHPSTPYVATFVGGANLLRGQWNGGQFSIDDAHFAFAKSDHPPPVGAGTIAVRHHAVRLDHPAGGPAFTVATVLFLGNQTEYRVQRGTVELRVIEDGPPRRTLGQQVAVSFSHAFAFDGTGDDGVLHSEWSNP